MNGSIMLSEEEIIRDIQMRRSRAAEILYDRYAPSLLAICMRYCGNREDAEDVLHDSFIKIIRKIHSFKPRSTGTFTGWMKTVTVNTALNFIRERNKWTKTQVPASQSGIDEDPGEPEENEFEMILAGVTKDKMMEMICNLPVGYRTVFNLYVFEDYQHKEIARELSISENTSKSQLSKARGMLKKQILGFVNKEKTIS